MATPCSCNHEQMDHDSSPENEVIMSDSDSSDIEDLSDEKLDMF